MPPWCTALSWSNLRQPGALEGFINIQYIETSDDNRLNYGKHMHNRACYITCNCQSKLSCRWTCDSPILHVPRHAPFPDWPWVYAHLHFAQGRAKRRRRSEKGKPSGFRVNPPSCLGSVLSAVYLISVCLSCNQSVVLNPCFDETGAETGTKKSCLLEL